MRIRSIKGYLPIIQKTSVDKQSYPDGIRHNSNVDSVSFGSYQNQALLYNALAYSASFKLCHKADTKQMDRLVELFKSHKKMVPSVADIMADLKKELVEKGLPTDDIPMPFSCDRSHKIGKEKLDRHIYVDDNGQIYSNDNYSDAQVDLEASSFSSKRWKKVTVFKKDQTAIVLPNGEIILELRKPNKADKIIIFFDPKIFPCRIRNLTAFSNGHIKPSDVCCNASGHISYDPNPDIKAVTLDSYRK